MAFGRYTGNVTGQVGSLITALDAALVTGEGWTKAFAAANAAAYQMPAGSTQHYLRVNDDGTGVAGAREAMIRGGEVMTDVNTFSVNPFPTTLLTDAGLIVRKSVSADATARPYKIFADDRSFIMFIQSEANAYYTAWGFGEIYSLVTTDAYHTAIFGRWAENSAVHSTYDPFYAGVIGALANSPNGGSFIARSYLGVGTYIDLTHYSHYLLQAGAVASGQLPVPNPPDGNLAIARRVVSENTAGANVLRGRIRGLWLYCGSSFPYNDGDTFNGVAELVPRTFEIIRSWPVVNGHAVIETSDTLETT